MHIIAAFSVALVVSSIFFILTFSMMVSLVVFIVVFFLLKKMLRKNGPSKTPPADFNARYAHDNIAIDVSAGKLWLRDRSGTRVVNKGDVLRWNRTYRTFRGAEIDNCLEIHLRDLDRPKSIVRFQRHSDTWRAAENAQDSEEWESRLTTWMNHT